MIDSEKKKLDGVVLNIKICFNKDNLGSSEPTQYSQCYVSIFFFSSFTFNPRNIEPNCVFLLFVSGRSIYQSVLYFDHNPNPNSTFLPFCCCWFVHVSLYQTRKRVLNRPTDLTFNQNNNIGGNGINVFENQTNSILPWLVI